MHTFKRFKDKFCLKTRMLRYLERNGKNSPLVEKEYIFLKYLYMYLTKQILDKESKKLLFKYYTDLVNLCYFPNLEDINKKMVYVIHLQCIIILEDQVKTPITFLQLNKESHKKKMEFILDLFENWALNDKKGNFMNEKEFWENLKFMRDQFNKDKIDIYYQIGKWPKKLRKRFNRQINHKE
jgi:hypothetical protein